MQVTPASSLKSATAIFAARSVRWRDRVAFLQMLGPSFASRYAAQLVKRIGFEASGTVLDNGGVPVHHLGSTRS